MRTLNPKTNHYQMKSQLKKIRVHQRIKKISKVCVTFNPKTQYHKIENRKDVYYVPSLKTHKIIIK